MQRSLCSSPLINRINIYVWLSGLANESYILLNSTKICFYDYLPLLKAMLHIITPKCLNSEFELYEIYFPRRIL